MFLERDNSADDNAAHTWATRDLFNGKPERGETVGDCLRIFGKIHILAQPGDWDAQFFSF